MTKTLVLKVQYDGTNYAGWQIQPVSISIQEKLEFALLKLFKKEVKVIGSGRTDAGVHALGQIASINIDFDIRIPENKILGAINGYLPMDIRIKQVFILDNLDKNFNARFDAEKREYIYYIIRNNNPLESRFASYISYDITIERLQEASDIFVGKYNFVTFSKVNLDTSSYICNIDKCEWTKERDDKFRLNIRSSHFVYGQVRALVGAMIDYARGKRTIDDLKTALKSENRELNSPFAPPQGLILSRIYYPERYGIE